jgi:hypothetical protein
MDFASFRLGHSDAPSTLEVYGHVEEDAHREAVEKVASLVDVLGCRTLTVNQWIQRLGRIRSWVRFPSTAPILPALSTNASPAQLALTKEIQSRHS